MITNESRREFLKGSGALLLGLHLPQALAQSGPGKTQDHLILSHPFEPNAFVRIGADSTVTVVVKHLEMGQGTYTGLPTLVAERPSSVLVMGLGAGITAGAVSLDPAVERERAANM